jgi:1-deoxy-D-xylulose 5-phosphate reductoisomerase
MRIAEVIDRSLQSIESVTADSLETILAADMAARQAALRIIDGMESGGRA